MIAYSLMPIPPSFSDTCLANISPFSSIFGHIWYISNLSHVMKRPKVEKLKSFFIPGVMMILPYPASTSSDFAIL